MFICCMAFCIRRTTLEASRERVSRWRVSVLIRLASLCGWKLALSNPYRCSNISHSASDSSVFLSVMFFTSLALVNTTDIQSVILQTAEQWYPVNTGGFHCDCFYTTLSKPFRYGVQVRCVCTEGSVVIFGAIRRHTDLHDTVRYIYPCRIGIDNPKFCSFGGLDFFAFFAMMILLLMLMDEKA